MRDSILVALVFFGVPLAICAVVGYLLGSWLVFLLLLLPAALLLFLIMASRMDGRRMAEQLAKTAEERARDGNRHGAASLYRNAARILGELKDLSAEEQQRIEDWKRRADRLSRGR